MSQIGAISVAISADGSGFTKATNRAQKEARQTGTALRNSAKAFAAWAAAAAAAFISIRKVSQQYGIMDNLAKTSDALSIQQERLQALQHTASLTGTSADQLSTNLERMQRNLGRVAREGGPAEKALKDIGISARDIINLPADQQLERIAQSMSGVENAAVRASIAQDLFGRDGVRMLKMMEQLKEDGLDPVVDELEQMGVALSRVDTAKVEAANDAMFKAGQVVEGIFNRIGVKFAPFVEQAALAIVELSKETQGFANVVDSSFKGAVWAVGTFADGLRGIQIITKGLVAGFEGFAFAVNRIFLAVTRSVDRLINGAIGSINVLIEGINKIPGVGVSAIDSFTSSATKMFEENAAYWSDSLSGTLEDMHKLAMKPLPSEGIKKFVDDVQDAAQKAAQSISDAQGGEGGDAMAMLTEAQIAELDKRLEAIRVAGLSEQALMAEKYEADLEALQEALEHELITQEHYNELALQTAERHADALTEIDRKAADERLRIEEMERRTKMQGMQTMFNNLSQLMNTSSRKLFEIGKASAIANAVVSAYEGIALTMSKYPYPLNVGMAAAHGAAAFAQVRAIKSQSFTSGAGAGQVFSGGQPATPVTGGVGPQQPSRNISISLTGSSFGAGGIRDLIGEINEAVGDGIKLNVTGG